MHITPETSENLPSNGPSNLPSVSRIIALSIDSVHPGCASNLPDQTFMSHVISFPPDVSAITSAPTQPQPSSTFSNSQGIVSQSLVQASSHLESTAKANAAHVIPTNSPVSSPIMEHWQSAFQSLDLALTELLRMGMTTTSVTPDTYLVYKPKPYSPNYQWTPRALLSNVALELPNGPSPVYPTNVLSFSNKSLHTSSSVVTTQPLLDRLRPAITETPPSIQVTPVIQSGDSLVPVDNQTQVARQLDEVPQPLDRREGTSSPPALTLALEPGPSRSTMIEPRDPLVSSGVPPIAEATKATFTDNNTQLTTGASTSSLALEPRQDTSPPPMHPASSTLQHSNSQQASLPPGSLLTTPFTAPRLTEAQKQRFIQTYTQVTDAGRTKLEATFRQHNMWDLVSPLVSSSVSNLNSGSNTQKIQLDNPDQHTQPLGPPTSLSKTNSRAPLDRALPIDPVFLTSPDTTPNKPSRGTPLKPSKFDSTLLRMAAAMLQHGPQPTAVILAAFKSLGIDNEPSIMRHLKAVATSTSSLTSADIWQLRSQGLEKLLEGSSLHKPSLSNNSPQSSPIPCGRAAHVLQQEHPLRSESLRPTSSLASSSCPSTSQNGSSHMDQPLDQRATYDFVENFSPNQARPSPNCEQVTIPSQKFQTIEAISRAGSPVITSQTTLQSSNPSHASFSSDRDPRLTAIQPKAPLETGSLQQHLFLNSLVHAEQFRPLKLSHISLIPRDILATRGQSTSSDAQHLGVHDPSSQGAKTSRIPGTQVLVSGVFPNGSKLNGESRIISRNRALNFLGPFQDDLPGFPDVNPLVQTQGSRARVLVRYAHDQQMPPIRTFFPISVGRRRIKNTRP